MGHGVDLLAILHFAHKEWRAWLDGYTRSRDCASSQMNH